MHSHFDPEDGEGMYPETSEALHINKVQRRESGINTNNITALLQRLPLTVQHKRVASKQRIHFWV
jgi:hypothetical protein